MLAYLSSYVSQKQASFIERNDIYKMTFNICCSQRILFLIDLLVSDCGCPNQPCIHLTYFINSLVNTIETQHLAGNSVFGKNVALKNVILFHSKLAPPPPPLILTVCWSLFRPSKIIGGVGVPHRPQSLIL